MQRTIAQSNITPKITSFQKELSQYDKMCFTTLAVNNSSNNLWKMTYIPVNRSMSLFSITFSHHFLGSFINLDFQVRYKITNPYKSRKNS